MKLNLNCIRDILFTVEEFETIILPDNRYPLISKYSDKELLYHVKQCQLSDFFVSTAEYICGNYEISDLSPAGHCFLSQIRDDNIWKKVLKKASQISVNSIPALITAVIDIIK